MGGSRVKAGPELTTAFSYVGATERPAGISSTPTGGGTAQAIGFAYDGALVKETDFGGPATGSFDYVWDDDLLLASTTLTAGATVATTSIARDDDGLPTTIGPFGVARGGPGGAPSSYGDGAIATELAYDTLGRVSQRGGTAAGAGASGPR